MMDKNNMNNKSDVNIQKCNECNIIDGNDLVYVTNLGEYVKITHMVRPPVESCIKKLNKYEYIDIRTGEIKKYNQSNITSLKDVKRKIRRYEDIVMNNFSGGMNEIFIVLTHRDNVTDIQVAKNNYNKFIKTLNKNYKDLEYIGQFEQTSKWCWHINLFVKSTTQSQLNIPQADLLNYWNGGIGYSDVGGVYVMQNINTRQTLGHSKENRDDKLERLTHFPKGEKYYHKSKGIKVPKQEKMLYKDCTAVNSGNYEIISSKTYEIRNPETDNFINSITTEIYQKNNNFSSTNNKNNNF